MNFLTKNVLKLILLTTIIPLQSWGDQIKLLANNNEALSARITLIENAKSEIFFEYYEVANDNLSLLSLSLLRKAAEKGIKVKILIDNMHNSLTDAQLAAFLGYTDSSPLAKEATKNIQIKVFNKGKFLDPFYLTYRNHDKLLNVDGTSMIIGGRNVSESYFGQSSKFNFKDADAIVFGASAADSKKYFESLWNSNPDVSAKDLYQYSADKLNQFCSGDSATDCDMQKSNAISEIKKAYAKMTELYNQHNSSSSKIKIVSLNTLKQSTEEVGPIAFVFNDPTKAIKDVQDKLAGQIMSTFLNHAKKEIIIATPYLFPTEEELQTLEKLSARQVKIKIVTNSLASTDEVIVHKAMMSVKARLAKMGVELYLFKGPEILHAKGAIIDNKISFIGSFNFDRRSALINREIGISIGINSTNESSVFTTQFNQFINDEIIANSILITKDGQELPMDKINALTSPEKLKEYDKTNIIKSLQDHI